MAEQINLAKVREMWKEAKSAQWLDSSEIREKGIEFYDCIAFERCPDCGGGELWLDNQSEERVLYVCQNPDCGVKYIDDRPFDGYWRIPPQCMPDLTPQR